MADSCGSNPCSAVAKSLEQQKVVNLDDCLFRLMSYIHFLFSFFISTRHELPEVEEQLPNAQSSSSS